jgi:excisionase family DNA binding protein
MSETATTLEAVLGGLLRRIIREEIRAALGNGQRNKETEKPYLTIKEAAEFSRLAPSNIRLLIRKRQLRAQKVGRRVLIKRSDLENFLEANPIEMKDGEFCP